MRLRLNFIRGFLWIFLVLALVGICYAQAAPESGIKFGEFDLSTVVAVLLGAVFAAFPTFPDRFKNLVAMAFGAGLGILGMMCANEPWGIALIITHVIRGVMYGVQAVGTYNVIVSLRKQRAEQATPVNLAAPIETKTDMTSAPGS
jgi:hypothetical protein